MASIALGHVDEDFRTNNDSDISAELTQQQITELRGQYAKDFLDDKRFVFGKYIISNDGNVRLSIFLQFNNFIFYVGSKVTPISKQSYFTNVRIYFQVYQGREP